MRGVAMGRKMRSNTMSGVLYLCTSTAGNRSRTSHHIAVHIAAGRQRGQENFIDSVDGRPQITFEYAMQLKPLACSYAQRVVCILSCQVILDKVLFGSQYTAGATRAYHELVGFLLSFRLTRLSHIS